MAGDWIKVEATLPDKPEVVAIAARAALDEDAVVGKLLRLWIWADAQSRDGHADGVTEKWINRYVRADGFAEALAAVGWIHITCDGVKFPNFDRHNGKSAKQRALGNRRKEASRLKRDKRAATVTEASRCERDHRVTREEKRREEPPPPTSSSSMVSTDPPPARQAGGGPARVRVEEPELRDPESLVGRLVADGAIRIEDSPAVTRLAAYCLEHGSRPAGLFVRRLRDRDFPPVDWQPPPRDVRKPRESHPVPDELLARALGPATVEERKLAESDPPLDPDQAQRIARQVRDRIARVHPPHQNGISNGTGKIHTGHVSQNGRGEDQRRV